MTVKLSNGVIINPDNVSVMGAVDKSGYRIVGLNDGTNLKLKEEDAELIQNSVQNKEDVTYENVMITGDLNTKNITNSNNITTSNLTITSGKLNVSQIETTNLKIGDDLYVDSDGVVHIKKLIVDDLVWKNGDLESGSGDSDNTDPDPNNPNNPGGDNNGDNTDPDPNNPNNPGGDNNGDNEDPDNPDLTDPDKHITPLTTSEALEKFSGRNDWENNVLIRGKIYGCCHQETGTLLSGNKVADKSIKLNIVIKDEAENSYIVVELPLGRIGDLLSLDKHPENLNKYVTVLGRYHNTTTEDSYSEVTYKRPTITNVSYCWFDEEHIPKDQYNMRKVDLSWKDFEEDGIRYALSWYDMLYYFEGDDYDNKTSIPKETYKNQIIYGYIFGYFNYASAPGSPIFNVPSNSSNKKYIILCNYEYEFYAGLGDPDGGKYIGYELVELPSSGKILDDLNLWDHPENLGKLVTLVCDCSYSTPYNYKTYPTITNIKGYWGGETNFDSKVFDSFIQNKYKNFYSFDPLTGEEYE